MIDLHPDYNYTINNVPNTTLIGFFNYLIKCKDNYAIELYLMHLNIISIPKNTDKLNHLSYYVCT